MERWKKEADNAFRNRSGVRETAVNRSGQRGNRTPDTRIFSPLLYQLSYLSFQREAKYRNFSFFIQRKNKNTEHSIQKGSVLLLFAKEKS